MCVDVTFTYVRQHNWGNYSIIYLVYTVVGAVPSFISCLSICLFMVNAVFGECVLSVASSGDCLLLIWLKSTLGVVEWEGRPDDTRLAELCVRLAITAGAVNLRNLTTNWSGSEVTEQTACECHHTPATWSLGGVVRCKPLASWLPQSCRQSWRLCQTRVSLSTWGLNMLAIGGVTKAFYGFILMS